MSRSTAWGTIAHSSSQNMSITDGVMSVTVPGVADRSVLTGHNLICTLLEAGLRWPARRATLTYDLWIPEGMDWGLQGWKFPGLAGHASGQGTTLGSGGTYHDDAWSGRLMVYSPDDADPDAAAKARQLHGYLYVAAVGGVAHDTYGQAVDFATPLTEGAWHTVGVTYVMNTAGSADGEFIGTLDGVQDAYAGDVMYRQTGYAHLGVTHLWHQVYAGGSGNVGPASPTTVQFRNLSVTTES